MLALNEEYENAVKTFIDELDKQLKELREEKYMICNVECVKESENRSNQIITSYFLNQEKYSKNMFEFALDEPEVISYIRLATARNNNL